MILKKGFEFFLTLFIPLLYIVELLILSQNTYSFTAPLSVIITGIIFTFLGLFLWATSYYYLRHAFGVLPQKQKRVTEGVYKYFRHPMYIGIWMTFVGLSFSLQSWQGLFFLLTFLTPVLAIRGYSEEKSLRD